MNAEPSRLDELLESVADGSPLDWDALAVSADPGQQRLIRHLRLVARVAEVHRTLVAEEPAAEVSDWPGGAGDDPAVARWGHLFLLEKIGEGAFGEVYRARDPWLDREVALKLMKPSVASAGATHRIVNEARTLARVRHPNVVTVHGADKHDVRVGLWMDLVRGRSLSQIVSEQGPFSASEAALTGQDVCRALAAVHAAGLVHRDIKAQNVMREAGGRLVLMDFGAGGTPLYLAPEVLAGGAPTIRSDLYALGVLLYYLATGRYPVEAPSLEELQRAHASGTRRRLAEQRPDLPDRFVAAVERALDPDPIARFQTAREMQEALADVTSSGPRPLPRRLLFPGDGSRLVRAAAIAAVGVVALSAWLLRPSVPAGPPVPPSAAINVVAVLPFENLSNDADEQYLAAGVAMELTARLADVGALRVVPWSFTRRFQSRPATLEDVVRATRADAVVEGSVQVLPGSASRAASRHVRVRVQLYRAGTGALLWTDVYERDFEDFLVLQSDIAQAIARKVNVVVARREARRLAQARRVTAEAMEDYLKARELLEGRYDIVGALELFRSATQRDPQFAEAYTGLATCQALEAAYLATVPSDVALRRALDASNRAIDLDPGMPEAFAARGFAQLALAWNWQAAEADFQRALDLGPNAAAVHDQYSNFLTIRGRHDDAIAAARRAEDRAPLSASYSRKVGWALYMAHRFDEAIAQLHRTLAIEPDYEPARTLLGRAYLLTGRDAEALREFEATKWTPMVAATLAKMGRLDEASRLLADLRASRRPARPYELALAYATMGDAAAALEQLETAFRIRDAGLAHLAVDPLLDPLRRSPQLAELLRRMSLAQ
jgi:TolB-like protein/tRNA A-37 threonylcarbamoyl transferase component Bud32/Tfp pilus assembly protein PilF